MGQITQARLTAKSGANVKTGKHSGLPTRTVLACALLALPLVAGCRANDNLHELRYAAKFENDHWAAYEIADMYAEGSGELPKDDVKATELYRQAAEAGIGWGQYTYGLRKIDGVGTDPDPTLGETWLRRAAENGITPAYSSLGELYANGTLGKKDQAEATKWYLKAAKNGDTFAQVEMANRYATGLGVEQSEPKATKWRLNAAKRGDTWSQVDLAERLMIGKGTKPNPEAALRIMERAAKSGNVYAQRRVAEFYDRGPGGTADPTAATLWLIVAANAGNTDAQYQVGMRLMAGKGIEPRPEEAVQWLERAAQSGNVEAQKTMAELYTPERSAPTIEPTMPSQNIVRASDTETPPTQEELAILHAKKNIVKPDPDKAMEWWRKAAEQGDAEAQLRLANLLLRSGPDITEASTNGPQ